MAKKAKKAKKSSSMMSGAARTVKKGVSDLTAKRISLLGDPNDKEIFQ